MIYPLKEFHVSLHLSNDSGKKICACKERRANNKANEANSGTMMNLGKEHTWKIFMLLEFFYLTSFEKSHAKNVSFFKIQSKQKN